MIESCEDCYLARTGNGIYPVHHCNKKCGCPTCASTSTKSDKTHQNNQLKKLLADCRELARDNGWLGDDTNYNYAKPDLDYVINNLGYKPTVSQWRDAGLQYVGTANIGE